MISPLVGIDFMCHASEILTAQSGGKIDLTVKTVVPIVKKEEFLL